MNDLMKDIVMSDCVQDLLSDAIFSIEDEQISEEEYKNICTEVQKLIDSDETLVLEPIQIASLVEEALIIHSSRRVKADSDLSRRFNSTKASVLLAYNKLIGKKEELKLN